MSVHSQSTCWGYRCSCSVLCAGLPVYWGYRYACSVAVCWATSVLGIQVRLFSAGLPVYWGYRYACSVAVCWLPVYWDTGTLVQCWATSVLGIQVRLFSGCVLATSVLGIQVRLFSGCVLATSVLGIQVRLFSGCVLGYQCTGDTGTLVQWLCAGLPVYWGYRYACSVAVCWATSVLGIQVRLFSGCVLGYQCTGDTGTLVQWLCAGLPVYWGYRYACSVAVCWATSATCRLYRVTLVQWLCAGLPVYWGYRYACSVLGYQCTGDTGTLVQWLCAGYQDGDTGTLVQCWATSVSTSVLGIQVYSWLPVYSVAVCWLPVYWGYRYACSVAVCWATGVLGIQVRLFSGCVLGYRCTGDTGTLVHGCVLGYQCTGDTGTLVQWLCAGLPVYWGYRYACSVAVCWASSVLGIQVRLFSGCVLGYQCTGDTGTLVQWLCAMLTCRLSGLCYCARLA